MQDTEAQSELYVFERIDLKQVLSDKNWANFIWSVSNYYLQ